MKLSIVVPCYNESRNIPLMLERFDKVLNSVGKYKTSLTAENSTQAGLPKELDEASTVKTSSKILRKVFQQRRHDEHSEEFSWNHSDIEVVIVNNGSKDDSAEVLKRLSPKYSFFKIVTVEVNQGYGFGILSGLKAATGDYLGWTHADLQTDPADVLRAFGIIQGKNYPQNIYVKGRRKGRPLADVFFTVGMSCFEMLYLGKFLFDINAQPNIFHRSFYHRWENPPHDFSLDLYVFYMAKHLNQDVVRFDVQFPKRIHGQSSWNTSFKSKLKFIQRTIDFSIKLKARIKNVA